MTENFCDEALARRFSDLEENLKRVRENIAQAAQKAGRSPEEVTLLAATKTVPPELINHAIELGVHCIGENRVQEFLQKRDSLHLEDCSCHMIGHLQTNKVRSIVGLVDMIESVDSVHLAKEISRLSQLRGVCTDILVEVNIGREESKSGVLPEKLDEILEEISVLPSIVIRGLMAIPPICSENAQILEYFSNMYQYFVDIKSKTRDNKKCQFDSLSMGMSSDYTHAIVCGATLVRIGSALFGPRTMH